MQVCIGRNVKAVYTDTKIFHFPAKLHDLATGRPSPPIHVRLKPTNRCPQRCSYCCFRNPQLPLSEKMNEEDEIPREKLLEIVEDIVVMGVRAVTFSGGGEPLCHPAFMEATEALVNGGVKVAVLTNGVLLTGEAARLLAHRAVWMRVSMDAANRELYARLRNCEPDQFDRVCENLHAFATCRGRTCTLGLNFVVTRENSGQVLEFLRLAKRIAADHVKVSPAVVGRSAEANAEYLGPIYHEVKVQIAMGKRELQDQNFTVVDKFHWPDSGPEAYQRTYNRCPFAQCLTVIGADQNLYTCQDKAYTAAGFLTSLRDRPFRAAWFDTETQRRLRELDPSVTCRHHCVAHTKNLMLNEFLNTHSEHIEFV